MPLDEHNILDNKPSLIKQRLNVPDMDHITVDRLKEMAIINEPYCISILLPTHRSGKEVTEMIDQKVLKQQVKEIIKQLKSDELEENEIEEILEPVKKLVEDSGFWKHQSDGLAIFRNKNLFEYYKLPVRFDAFAHIADHFYPTPLIHYINDTGKFYLLALSLSYVRVYECYSHQISELETKELIPEKLEDVVGFDYREKSLQFRQGQTGTDQSMFHGHGRTNEEEKKLEILKLFREVNKGLMQLLKDQEAPLVIAAVDYLMPIYKQANSYINLQEDFVAGNPEHEDPASLQEKARSLMESYFSRDNRKKAKAFELALSDHKASYNEDEIIPATINKRVDTLFIKNGEKMWGIYDKNTNKIISLSRDSDQATCLVNMAAMHTILNNGKVIIAEPDEMPEPLSKLNAIYRF